VIPLEDNQLLLDRWNTVKLRQFLCSTTGDEAATTTMYGRKQARRGTAVSSVSVEPIHSRTGSAPPASQKFIPFQILAPRATPSLPYTNTHKQQQHRHFTGILSPLRQHTPPNPSRIPHFHNHRKQYPTRPHPLALPPNQTPLLRRGHSPLQQRRRAGGEDPLPRTTGTVGVYYLEGDSYWNMCCTNTHTQRVVGSVYTRFRNVWEGLVVNEMNVFCEFYRWWMNECEAKGVPLLMV